jgi:hypothetical protein
MSQSELFVNRFGLDVHAGTEILADTWLLVSSVVVRIGNDAFELNNNGTHFVKDTADAILKQRWQMNAKTILN